MSKRTERAGGKTGLRCGPRGRKGWADRGAGRDGAGPSAGRDWADGFGLSAVLGLGRRFGLGLGPG